MAKEQLALARQQLEEVGLAAISASSVKERGFWAACQIRQDSYIPGSRGMVHVPES